MIAEPEVPINPKVVEKAIRSVPGQKDLCLWLKKTVVTESEYDIHDGKRYRWIYQRRCTEPRGHDGPHVIGTFPLLREEVSSDR